MRGKRGKGQIREFERKKKGRFDQNVLYKFKKFLNN